MASIDSKRGRDVLAGYCEAHAAGEGAGLAVGGVALADLAWALAEIGQGVRFECSHELAGLSEDPFCGQQSEAMARLDEIFPGWTAIPCIGARRKPSVMASGFCQVEKPCYLE